VSSKHLVMGFTKAAALDLAPYRVHVNAICPGFVDSAFAEYDEATRRGVESMHPFGKRMGVPNDIAGIAVFLASDDARWVQGAGIVVDGGFTCQ
jgi:NAD(P)-dependent dehydrogenase (short-subunit alcohol dehydrogenase family)